MDGSNDLSWYQRAPDEWGAAVGPKLLEAIRMDRQRGLDWKTRWVWVETKACAALHRAALKEATLEERQVLWQEEPLRAKVVVMQLSDNELQRALWQITDSDDKRAIRDMALRGATIQHTRQPRGQPELAF